MAPGKVKDIKFSYLTLGVAGLKMIVRILGYRKALFLVICVCTTGLMLYNSLTLQCDVKNRAQRQSRTMFRSLESVKKLRHNSTSSYDTKGLNEVIMSRLLTQTHKLEETMNYTSIRDNSFDRWLAYNQGDLAMFTFSAVTSNVSIEGYTQSIVINGWEDVRSRNTPSKCCFMWKSTMKTHYIRPIKLYFKVSPRSLSAVQVYCPVKGHVRDVKGVTLEDKNKNCPTESYKYVKPSIAIKQKNGTLAICGKIVYNTIDIKVIIEWVEYYRQMKADKLVIYTYNLTKKAEAVIQYYAQTGFVETGQFDFPFKSEKKREVGSKNWAAWTDEQVVVFDCFERLKGYTYFSIVDLDEFILPRQQIDLKAMMADLMRSNPLAAGFSFRSHLFIKDWGKVETNNGTDIEQYFNRTSSVYTRPKNIILTERIIQRSIHTHSFSPKPGFIAFLVNSETAVINHYRSCYENFMNNCTNSRRFTDRSILQFSNKYKQRKAVLLKRFT